MKTIRRFVGYVVEPLWAMLVYFIVIVCGDSLKDLRNVGKTFVDGMHNFVGNSWHWYMKTIKHKKTVRRNGKSWKNDALWRNIY